MNIAVIKIFVECELNILSIFLGEIWRADVRDGILQCCFFCNRLDVVALVRSLDDSSSHASVAELGHGQREGAASGRQPFWKPSAPDGIGDFGATRVASVCRADLGRAFHEPCTVLPPSSLVRVEVCRDPALPSLLRDLTTIHGREPSTYPTNGYRAIGNSDLWLEDGNDN